MSQVFYSPALYHWEKQSIAANSGTWLQNVWKTVLGFQEVSAPVRLLYVSVTHDSVEAAVGDVECRITVDGVELTGTVTQNDSTWYYWYLTPIGNAVTGGTTIYNVGYYSDFRGLDVKVEFRITSVPGTDASYSGRVQYEVLRRGGICR